ncbi:E3 ubiquitin-protein ligase ARK2C-like protein [Drosera capensis]
MVSGASETPHLPPELWELYPELTYEELIEHQVMLETSIKDRPAVYGEASCSSDPFSLLKAEAGALSKSSDLYLDLDSDMDMDLNEAIARSLQDDLCHLTISEPLESAPGSTENTSASSSNTTGVNQAHRRADAETYEELQQLCETVGNESKGLSAREISRLKSFEYKSKKSRLFGKKPKATENKTTECSICLKDFENGENITTLPCLHQYHHKCIKHWLKENKGCPICRIEVKT